MLEVIDLLSSPIKPSQRQSPTKRNQPSPTKDVFNISAENFHFAGLSDDFEIPQSQPSKKRKVAPSPEKRQLWTNPDSNGETVQLLSDDEELPALKGSVLPTSRTGSTLHGAQIDNSDPIMFTSSAPDRRSSNKASVFDILDLSDDLPDTVFRDDFRSLSQPPPVSNPRGCLSERTANLLATIGTKGSKGGLKGNEFRTRHNVRPKASKPACVVAGVEDISSTPPVELAPDKRNTSSKPTELEKKAKEEARAATKAAREAEKEVERERKRLAREQKVQEKRKATDIAEVNKSKTDKKKSVSEMILDMSDLLQSTSIGNQVEQYMKHLDVDITYFGEDLNMPEGDAIVGKRLPGGSIVKWRRKVTATYNEELDIWEPLAATRIENEKHVLIYLTATDFVSVAVGLGMTGSSPNNSSNGTDITEVAMKAKLDAHVESIRKRYRNCKPIYLIEGLAGWLRKNKNAQNRAYTAAVLSQMNSIDEQPPSASYTTATQPKPSRIGQQRRRRPAATAPATADLSSITDDTIETLLLHLQLTHSPILIHQTTSPNTTASWIAAFTQHISTIPYRLQKMHNNDAHAAFCMDNGQIRSSGGGGSGGDEALVLMLQQIHRVTPAMAHAVVARWPSVRSLVLAFRTHGPTLLQDVRKAVNRDGALSDTRIGPAVSRRVYKVFFGVDPGGTDGIV